MRRARHIHNIVGQFIRGIPELKNLEVEDAAALLEDADFITVDRSKEPWRYTETEKMRAIPPYDFPAAVRKYLINKLREALYESGES